MQRGRGGRDPFFNSGDPFSGFGGGLGSGLGGFGGQRSLVSSFFGGRDPFDDPFFSNPFGGMFEPSFFGSSQNPFFGSSQNPFAAMQQPSGFLEPQPQHEPKKKGPIIEELNSDAEEEDGYKDNKENPRKHGRSNKPIVEDPNEQVEEKKIKHFRYKDGHNSLNVMQSQPQAQSFSFHSSTVTYGGPNGAYYSSSTTKRAGSDGVTMEESKEANTATGLASHRLSRGLHNKGHSVARKLNSDGRVDTMQTLHNLDQDELGSFEEAWNGSARRHLPGWNENFRGYDSLASSSGQDGSTIQRGWALPATPPPQSGGRTEDTQ